MAELGYRTSTMISHTGASHAPASNSGKRVSIFDISTGRARVSGPLLPSRRLRFGKSLDGTKLLARRPALENRTPVSAALPSATSTRRRLMLAVI